MRASGPGALRPSDRCRSGRHNGKSHEMAASRDARGRRLAGGQRSGVGASSCGFRYPAPSARAARTCRSSASPAPHAYIVLQVKAADGGIADLSSEGAVRTRAHTSEGWSSRTLSLRRRDQADHRSPQQRRLRRRLDGPEDQPIRRPPGGVLRGRMTARSDTTEAAETGIHPNSTDFQLDMTLFYTFIIPNMQRPRR